MESLLDWLRVVLVTALLIPLVYLTTRLVGRKYGGTVRGRNFEVLEYFVVDQHNKLLLARLLDKHFVLSASDNGLKVVFEVTDPALIEELTKQAEKPESSGSSWYRSMICQDRRNRG